MIGTRSATVGTPQPGPGEQIREQVRRDVEEALREARQGQPNVDEATRAALERAAARLEAEAARLEAQGARAEVRPAGPPALPRGISIRQRGPNGESVVFSGTRQPGPFPPDIPPRVADVAMALFFTIALVFIGTPLARAFARRVDRKPVAAPAAAGPDVVTRLDRIEQAVDAIALEVERISEGQRYVTKLMAEPRALPSPNDAAGAEMPALERGPDRRAPAGAERGT